MWSRLALIGLLPLVVTAAVVPQAEKVDYSGYKVFHVTSDGNSAAVHEQTRNFRLSHISTPSKVEVVVAPERVAAFHALGLNSTLKDDDLGVSIAAEANFGAFSANDSWFSSYHPFEDHLRFLREIQAKLPNNSEVFSAGKSFQGRPLQGIRIWGPAGRNAKPNIVVHGNAHAREWITSTTVEYLAYQLILSYGKVATVTKVLAKYQFELIPIVNPDGFVYSQTTNRLWRKNRQPVSGSSCIGRDNNRNWAYKWDVSGSSTDPCAETFRGRAPADSPETKATQDHILSLKKAKGVALYIDTHSYGQYILDAYGYSCTATAKNQARQNQLIAGAARAIKSVFGTQYKTGQTCKTMYPAAGSSMDWVSDAAGAPYAFAFELRDTGGNGFTLPPSQIRPTAVETYVGWTYLFNNI